MFRRHRFVCTLLALHAAACGAQTSTAAPAGAAVDAGITDTPGASDAPPPAEAQAGPDLPDVADVAGAAGVGDASDAVDTLAGPHSEQQVSIFYNQGVARADDGWIFSGTNGLFRTDEAFNETLAIVPAIPDALATEGYAHIGDIDAALGVLWAPLEQPDYGKATQRVARYDPKTLAFVDSVTLPLHHAAWIAVDPALNVAWMMRDYDDDTLVRFDIGAGWKELAPLPLSSALVHVQGGDLGGGFLWLSTDDPGNRVYRADLQTGQVTLVATMGHLVAGTIAKQEGEGIDVTPLDSGQLHTVLMDLQHATVQLGHFQVAGWF